MVVFHRTAKVPVSYSAPLCSIATFMVTVLYAAAIVVPYVLGGFSYNLFRKSAVKYVTPKIKLLNGMRVELKRDSAVYPYVSGSTDKSIVTPLVEVDWKENASLYSINLTYDTTVLNGADSIDFHLPIQITVFDKSYNTTISYSEKTFLPAQSLVLHGNILIDQEETYLYPDSSTDSATLKKQIAPVFKKVYSAWGNEGSTGFIFSFLVQVPMVEMTVKASLLSSLESGWSTYLSIAIITVAAARFIIEFILKSKLVPAIEKCEVILIDRKLEKLH